MSRSNRDHAKKKHRPMVEDETIAQQLEDLLTPAIASQQGYYRQLGPPKPNSELTLDGGSSVDTLVAGRSRSGRTHANAS